jgi:hypothetical protein
MFQVVCPCGGEHRHPILDLRTRCHRDGVAHITNARRTWTNCRRSQTCPHGTGAFSARASGSSRECRHPRSPSLRVPRRSRNRPRSEFAHPRGASAWADQAAPSVNGCFLEASRIHGLGQDQPSTHGSFMASRREERPIFLTAQGLVMRHQAGDKTFSPGLNPKPAVQRSKEGSSQPSPGEPPCAD